MKNKKLAAVIASIISMLLFAFIKRGAKNKDSVQEPVNDE